MRLRRRKNSAQILVVSHNAFRELKADEVYADFVRILRKKPDVVGVNEAANHIDTIRLVAANRGYRVLVPKGSRAERNDILVVRRETCRVKDWGHRLMAAETNGTPARYQVWADLENRKTGIDFTAHADHANSHIERKSWWRLARWHRGARPHFRKMAAQARRAKRGVWIGDMNVNARRRVVRATKLFAPARMKAAGARSSYDAIGLPKLGTHGRRLIDYVFAKGIGFVRHSVGQGYNTDHRPLFVVLELRR